MVAAARQWQHVLCVCVCSGCQFQTTADTLHWMCQGFPLNTMTCTYRWLLIKYTTPANRSQRCVSNSFVGHNFIHCCYIGHCSIWRLWKYSHTDNRSAEEIASGYWTRQLITYAGNKIHPIVNIEFFCAVYCSVNCLL